MAIFAGYDLGITEDFGTAPEPKGRQVNAYPGVNGLEILDMGTRGLKSWYRGVMLADNAMDLGFLKQTLGAFVLDGGQYPYLDPDGTLWLGVIMTAFRPIGPRYPMAGSNWLAQRFELEFLHNDV